MHLFHTWTKWSKPLNTKFYASPPMLTETYRELTAVEGQMQERTCTVCGKYDWRKV